ncbi:MAG: diguanylate cyclase, partial [Marinobacter sp.]|nr:diguanylate cyclase [Marinobacter sp.]
MQPERPDYPGLTRLKESHSPRRRALWTTLVYLVAGFIWITFSDRIVELWFPDPRMLSLVQTWKGFLFVVVTGLVLFTVILRQL